MRQREEEAGVLRAKLFLDMYTVNLKIVPEYPDLVEENQLLTKDVSDKDQMLEDLNTQYLSVKKISDS